MNERSELIVKLISGQDARKWDVKALVEWASSVADSILRVGLEDNPNKHAFIQLGTVRSELERMLDVRATFFTHSYDIGRDEYEYRFEADAAGVSFCAHTSDLLMPIEEFRKRVIDPAAAIFRANLGKSNNVG